ncbi:MAG: hypothetical protein OXE05_09075 [Chloroflexi bacterium]|nr:hypothetical protein [Chloroflexota bacterium]
MLANQDLYQRAAIEKVTPARDDPARAFIHFGIYLQFWSFVEISVL